MSTMAANDTVQQLGLKSYQMSTSINRAQRAFRDLLSTCLGHHGLTIPKWTLLGELYATGSLRPNVSAKQLGFKPPYITRIIAALEVDQLIAIEEFADDGRGKTIVLTEKGRQLVEYVEVKLEHCLNEQLGGVKKSDLQTYFGMSEFIAKNVKH